MPASPDDPFERALEEARRRDQTTNDGGFGRAGGPRVNASLDFGPAAGSGGEARFDMAADWTDEPAERPERAARPSNSEAGEPHADTPAEIAAELGLTGPLTLDQLGFRWRTFVWRHHPDRQPAHARDRANARVAIANTLYDQARRELAKQR